MPKKDSANKHTSNQYEVDGSGKNARRHNMLPTAKCPKLPAKVGNVISSGSLFTRPYYKMYMYIAVKLKVTLNSYISLLRKCRNCLKAGKRSMNQDDQQFH